MDKRTLISSAPVAADAIAAPAIAEQALWDELRAQFNLKSLLTASTGVQMGGWYDREVASLESFEGLRVKSILMAEASPLTCIVKLVSLRCFNM